MDKSSMDKKLVVKSPTDKSSSDKKLVAKIPMDKKTSGQKPHGQKLLG